MKNNIIKITIIILTMMGQSFAQEINDPWEETNRSVHKFNMKLDEEVLEPISTYYKENVNRAIKKGVSNFFSNIGESKDAVNQLLQGKLEYSMTTMARIAINTTIGVAGIFDLAEDFGLEKLPEEDFGQTLATWGVSSGPYVVLPVLGPSTLRDTVGVGVDISNMEAFSSIYRINDALEASVNIINERAKYDFILKMMKKSDDPYQYTKSLYTQKRQFDITGVYEDELEFE